MINASIVLYKHPFPEIEKLVNELLKSDQINEVFLIDNSPKFDTDFKKLPVTYIFNNRNLGYGAAHNIAIRKTIEHNIPYHLVINPDIQLESAVLDELGKFMESHSEVGQLMPKVLYPDGKLQYLCKLLPKPFDLFIRRFLPDGWIQKSNERFELRKSGYNKIMEVPYLSGCFMLLRTNVLKEVGLFDERFFMYPEDIDLTRRMYNTCKTVFYPYVSIIHNHTQGSYRSAKLLFIHLWNLVKYFNKWGWFFDSERKKINNETLSKLNLL
ncbi:MAG: glycosyltransferase [Paludibacteraceae bacterium]